MMKTRDMNSEKLTYLITVIGILLLSCASIIYLSYKMLH